MSDEINSDEHEKLISKKAVYHKFCKVHITLRGERGWENGWINETGADYLLLKLTDEGISKHLKKEIPLFFIEIKDIEEYKEVEK